MDSSVFDSEVQHNFSGYSLFRCDREGRVGGGVCLYLREDLTGEVLGSFCNKACQFLVVNIHQLDTVVCPMYHPPDTTISEFQEALDSLGEILDSLPTPTPTILFQGDFNFPRLCVEWRRSAQSQGE